MGISDFLTFVGRRVRSHWSILTVVSIGVVAAVATIAASVLYFDSLGDISFKDMVTTRALTLSPTLNSLLVSLPTNR